MSYSRSLTVLLSCVAAATALTACDSQQPAATESPPGTAIDATRPAPADRGQVDAGAVAEDGKATSFHARGNEPFWSVKVDGQTLVYTTPDIQPGVEFAAARTDNATDVEFRGSDDGKDFVLIVTPGQCDDTMSDEVFDYTAIFSYGEEHFTGCASGED